MLFKVLVLIPMIGYIFGQDQTQTQSKNGLQTAPNKAEHITAKETSDDNPDDWGGNWDEDWVQADSPWSHTGFLEAAYGYRLRSDDIFSNQQTLSELRWHQSYDYNQAAWQFRLAFDLWSDGVLHDEVFDLRELNFSFGLLDNIDVTMGRQITTWGTGDLLFLNDLFAKDWVSFFSGREDAYLKAPANAARLTGYFDWFNVDFVYTPEAEPDRYISGRRFSLFNPMAGQIGGFEAVNPSDPDGGEYALRLFKNLKGHELALYGYHGTLKSPTGLDNQFRPTYYDQNVFGVSWRSTIGKGLVNTEIAYYEALDDKDGNNPFVPNGQWRFLIGYERELLTKLTWGMQYYVEKIDDFSALEAATLSPDFSPDEYRQVITNRLTYLSRQDKLTWSLFVFYSPTEKDSYWRPSVNYRHNDHWNYSLGGNLFTGAYEHTFFGQFETSSNTYLRIRYQF